MYSIIPLFLFFINLLANGKELKVGVVLPLSGSISSYGRDCLAGMQVAMEEITSEGGKISIVVQDNYGDPTASVDAVKNLVAQGVHLIIGPLTSKNVIEVAPYIDKLKLPLIAPAATSPKVTEASSSIIRICYTDELQGKSIANFAYYVLGKRTTALLVDRTQTYSKDLADAFKQHFQQLGGRVLTEETYATGDTYFQPQLQIIKTYNPDCIFVPGYYEDVASIIKQAAELGIVKFILGGDGWDSSRLLELIGPQLGPYFFCTHFFKNDPSVRAFRDAYKRKTLMEPSSFSALGYDAIKILDVAQFTDTTATEIVYELRRVENFNGVTGNLSFKTGTGSPGRDPQKEVLILRLEKGTLSLEQKLISSPRQGGAQ